MEFKIVSFDVVDKLPRPDKKGIFPVKFIKNKHNVWEGILNFRDETGNKTVRIFEVKDETFLTEKGYVDIFMFSKEGVPVPNFIEIC